MLTDVINLAGFLLSDPRYSTYVTGKSPSSESVGTVVVNYICLLIYLLNTKRLVNR
jgi:hypothetical protein